MKRKLEADFNKNEKSKLFGMEKWCQEYIDSLPPPIEAIQFEIDRYMESYDKRLLKEKEIALQQDGIPDEEGWVKVTGYGRNKGAPRTVERENKINQKEKKLRRKKELLHFYAWQDKNSKLEHLEQLQKKFQEDKLKIAQMKLNRKFKPF